MKVVERPDLNCTLVVTRTHLWVRATTGEGTFDHCNYTLIGGAGARLLPAPNSAASEVERLRLIPGEYPGLSIDYQDDSPRPPADLGKIRRRIEDCLRKNPGMVWKVHRALSS